MTGSVDTIACVTAPRLALPGRRSLKRGDARSEATAERRVAPAALGTTGLRRHRALLESGALLESAPRPLPGVSVVGQPAGRGLLRKPPTVEELLLEIDRWFTAEAGEVLRRTRLGVDADERPAVFVGLHPAAPEVEIVATTDDRVTLTAVTAPAGPGYHTFLGHLVPRLGTDLEVTWSQYDAASEGQELTEIYEPDDRPGVEAEMLAWLRPVLLEARASRARGGDTVHLGLPSGTLYDVQGAVATNLGPRDDTWLEQAVAQPAMALDVWPWWADATDARYLLNRALCLMWRDVRWRPPGTVEEAELMDEVRSCLRRAHSFDPALPFPWREWAELLRLRGGDEPLADLVASRAAEADDRPPIGYRRRPVTIVHEGWSVAVPGSFAERRSADEWWGGEGGRGITLAATTTGTDFGPMAPEEFLAQVAGGLGGGALQHRQGPVVGAARLTTDTSSGIEVAVLEGYSAVVGSGAAIRIVFENPADWNWALDTWRGLGPA